MEVLYLTMPGPEKRILREGLRRGSRSGCIDPGHRYSVREGETVQISTFVSMVYRYGPDGQAEGPEAEGGEEGREA